MCWVKSRAPGTLINPPFFAGTGWKVVTGLKEGQTQSDTPSCSNSCIWAHPIDIHLHTKGLQDWPKLLFEVHQVDKYGRSELAGYGFCNIPSSPGLHNLVVPTWRPRGSARDRFRQFFLGGSTQLTEPNLVCTSEDRYQLSTESMGNVLLELGIVLRNFKNQGVEI
ncbi:B9 domain-containing protein 2-like isoform X2 [Neocloeon triangulifer]|uniref:B9 domain-containing protein 2-like isoform X2 n=1 Tax=Neocloeon triangulifer TaxID=2078957 RepID=UPI00286F7E3E|nr:B9 domain-containing protein 2-like isoform X2 [Neocloeon triangulifer]